MSLRGRRAGLAAACAALAVGPALVTHQALATDAADLALQDVRCEGADELAIAVFEHDDTGELDADPVHAAAAALLRSVAPATPGPGGPLVDTAALPSVGALTLDAVHEGTAERRYAILDDAGALVGLTAVEQATGGWRVAAISLCSSAAAALAQVQP